jgi:pimeloyl-ACP methyl ester carboxylesterase
MLHINGLSLYVEDHGSGRPVLLLHGWPDSAYLWRNQIPFLVKNGFRAIAPDLRGFGRSERPEGVAAYAVQNAVGDVVGILDALGIGAAHIVGHDWGSRSGLVHGYVSSRSCSQARRSLRATSTRAAHAAAARNGLVPAAFPVRGNRRGVVAKRGLGAPEGAEPRQW